MVNLDRVDLGDVTHESKERTGEAHSKLRVFGVTKGDGLTDEPRYQSKDLSRYKIIKPGMFAYNPMRLNIGSIGFCDETRGVGLISPDYVVFRCDTTRLIPRFFDYHTRSRSWLEWLKYSGEGSVRERIYFSKLSSYPIELPDTKYQEMAVLVLSALDNKIALNRQMNETLEAMARALFCDWFVDYGPTRAKMEGHDPYLDPEIWSLFPNQLDEEGQPEGWV